MKNEKTKTLIDYVTTSEQPYPYPENLKSEKQIRHDLECDLDDFTQNLKDLEKISFEDLKNILSILQMELVRSEKEIDKHLQHEKEVIKFYEEKREREES